MKDDDKLLDKWLDNQLSALPLESPSMDFSNNVMQQILTEKSVNENILKYKPLISKPVWIIIALICAGMGIFMYLSGNSLHTTQFPSWLTHFSDWSINWNIELTKPEIPATMAIGLLIFSLMAIVEIQIIQKYLLKNK